MRKPYNILQALISNDRLDQAGTVKQTYGSCCVRPGYNEPQQPES
jgi:hypothetical protein